MASPLFYTISDYIKHLHRQLLGQNKDNDHAFEIWGQTSLQDCIGTVC